MRDEAFYVLLDQFDRSRLTRLAVISQRLVLSTRQLESDGVIRVVSAVFRAFFVHVTYFKSQADDGSAGPVARHAYSHQFLNLVEHHLREPVGVSLRLAFGIDAYYRFGV